MCRAFRVLNVVERNVRDRSEIANNRSQFSGRRTFRTVTTALWLAVPQPRRSQSADRVIVLRPRGGRGIVVEVPESM